jgi:hypothetical protein
MYQIFKNGSKIDQVAIKFTNILQDTPKFTQNLDFWFENIPYGNPGPD